MKPTLAEIDQLADVLRGFLETETPETSNALAWLARNRVLDSGDSIADACASLKHLSPPSAVITELSNWGLQKTCDDSFCRALAFVCDAWSGHGQDPTHGAVMAHRHDQNPHWAGRAEPTALIGSFVFYRSR